jgi:hypothetical protein
VQEVAGTGAMLCFIGHAMMDEAGSAIGPRNPPQGSGLIVRGDLTQADGHAERRAALDMVHRHSPGVDTATDARRRQGLRCRQVRRRPPPGLRHPACRAEIEIFSDPLSANVHIRLPGNGRPHHPA